jgi:hypothetical protein
VARDKTRQVCKEIEVHASKYGGFMPDWTAERRSAWLYVARNFLLLFMNLAQCFSFFGSRWIDSVLQANPGDQVMRQQPTLGLLAFKDEKIRRPAN